MATTSPAPDPGLSIKLKRFFPQSLFFIETHDLAQAQVGDLNFTVGSIDYKVSEESQGDSQLRKVEQTIAYYESDTLRFPQFTLQPEKVMSNLLSGMFGVQDINFPSNPEFSKAYSLTAVHEQNTRKLFNGPVLEALARRRGLCVVSYSRSLLVFRPGTGGAAEHFKGFTGEAAEIIRLFEESARKSNLTMDAALNAKVDVRALVERLPGLVGSAVRAALVTRGEMNTFVRSQPPRAIPANILRYRDRFLLPMVFILFGLFFACAAGAFAVHFGYQALSRGQALPNVAIVLGLFSLGAGGSIIYFAGRVRIRMNRLLRDGRMSAATLEKIEAAGVNSNSEAITRMTVRFLVDGRPIQASCDLMGDAVERAQRFMVDKKPVPILYDPANPRRILFVESLMNISPEYEL